MWLFYIIGHRQMWYAWRAISIFTSGTVFWKLPLWMLVPHHEVAPAAVWEGDYNPRALAEPRRDLFRKAIAKTCGTHGHFTCSESLKKQWIHGGGAAKPLLSLLFKRKKESPTPDPWLLKCRSQHQAKNRPDNPHTRERSYFKYGVLA